MKNRYIKIKAKKCLLRFWLILFCVCFRWFYEPFFIFIEYENKILRKKIWEKKFKIWWKKFNIFICVGGFHLPEPPGSWGMRTSTPDDFGSNHPSQFYFYIFSYCFVKRKFFKKSENCFCIRFRILPIIYEQKLNLATFWKGGWESGRGGGGLHVVN